jgi:hypothetical protein
MDFASEEGSGILLRENHQRGCFMAIVKGDRFKDRLTKQLFEVK